MAYIRDKSAVSGKKIIKNMALKCAVSDDIFFSKFSPTYPALLAVPRGISDNTLNYAKGYRSRGRVPVLTYLHPVNNCSITRSSQPLLGVRQNRSIQDEKLLSAIFTTSRTERLPIKTDGPEPQLADVEELDDSNSEHQKKRAVYGAQQSNLIVDARPTVNAFAMQAVGLGSENMDHYKFATKAYLGIDNIHVMRDSLAKVVDALKDSDVTPLGPNKDQLAKSGWLKHIAAILDGADMIVRQVALFHSHVLIHCSDGWDRTSQLSALSQLCLDPYYRTIEGFMVLVEKDWLAFGHMFRHRSGLLNSEKWFQVENERVAGDSNRSFSEGGGAGKALENALLSAKGFFHRDNAARDSPAESDGEQSDTPGSRKVSGAPHRTAVVEKEVTKVKETSPVFHQFLDAAYQLLNQYPTRFEFNERFLRRLLYHLYSCQYGTFLHNSERERVKTGAHERTRSVWDYFIARREQFLNPLYDTEVDDFKRGKERVILPRVNEVKWWSEVFGRSDAEMNGPRTFGMSSMSSSSRDGSSIRRSPVVTGIETAEGSMGTGTSTGTGTGTTTSTGTQAATTRGGTQGGTQGGGISIPTVASSGVAALSAGISNLAFPKSKGDNEDENGQTTTHDSPNHPSHQMEVEMQ